MTEHNSKPHAATFRRPLATVSPVFRAQLPGSLAAPPERTLVDILQDTAKRFPDASALDDGHQSLSYAQLLAAVRAKARELHLAGLGAGDKIGVRIPSGTNQLYISHPGRPAHRGGVRPGGRGRPGRARQAGVRRSPGRRHITRRRGDCDGGPAAPPVPGPAAARPGRRRLGHLHLRLHRNPQRRRGAAPFLGGLRRRRGPALPAGRTRRPAGPGPGRAVGGLRRLLRGNVAGLAARRLPGPGAAGPGPDRHGPRPLADQPRHHGRFHRAHPRRALAGGVPGERPPADFRRRGVPAGPRRAARRRRPRGLEHLRPHRGHRRRLRRAAGRSRSGPDRPAAGRLGPRRRGRRLPAGRRRRSRRTDHRRRRPGPVPGPGQGRREVCPHAVARLDARLPLRRPGPLRGRGADLPGPRRRTGQARRAPDRTRRDRRRPAGAAGCGRRGRHGADDGGRQPDPRRLPGPGRRPGSRSGRRPGAARREPAGPADPAADRGRFAAHEDQRQSRPARAAVAAGGGRGRRRRSGPAEPPGRRNLDRGAVGCGAGQRRVQPGRRLLRLRRRVPRRRAARLRPARALPHHHGGRHLRHPPGRGAHRRRAPVPARRRGGPGPGTHGPAHGPQVAGLPDPDGRSAAHPGRACAG